MVAFGACEHKKEKPLKNKVGKCRTKAQQQNCRNVAVEKVGYKHAANANYKSKCQCVKAKGVGGNRVHINSVSKCKNHTAPHSRIVGNDNEKGNDNKGRCCADFNGKQGAVVNNGNAKNCKNLKC